MNEKNYIRKRKIKATLSKIPYYIFGILPIKKNKIVFSAFEGGGYCCNPKYIAEEFIKREHKYGEKYELIWLVNDIKKKFPSEINKKKNNLFNRAYHLSTAKVWVDNARKNYGTRKRKNQYYLLTWHGMIGFKPVGRLRGESFSKIAELVSMDDSKNVDALLSNSDWCSDVWEKAFWNEPVVKTGSPRCDILFNHREEKRVEIRQKYGLKEDTKIVMCAPTFRGGSQTKERKVFAEDYTIDFKLLKENLKDKFSGEWIVFVRLHPQLALRGISSPNNKDNGIIDFTLVDDMYELLAATDVFVSDYSSAAFDAALLRIPVFLYVDDLEDYVSDRGTLLWDIEDIPFPMAKDNKELSENINSFDMYEYKKKLEKLFKNIKLIEDGKAAERVVELIKRKS